MKNLRTKKFIESIAFPIIVFALVTILWAIVSFVTDSEIIVPSPSTTAREFIKIIQTKKFFSALFGSCLRAFLAFSISVIFAFIVALVCAISSLAQKLISPLIAFMRSLPTMAVVLILVIWTNAQIAPIIVTILVLFPTLESAVYDSATNLDKNIIEIAKVSGANRFTLLTKIYLPITLVACSSSIASSLALSLKLIVASEVLASTALSLGGMMNLSQIYLETASLMAITVATVLVAFALEKLLALLLKVFLSRWS